MYTQFKITTNALNTTLKHTPGDVNKIASLQVKRVQLVLTMTEQQFKDAFTGGK